MHFFKLHLAIWCQHTCPDSIVLSYVGTKDPRQTPLMAVQMTYLQRMPTPLPCTAKSANGRRHVNIQRIMKYAFTYKETDGEELAVCVVCSSVQSNETMKPSKLQRHSKTTHAHLKYFFYTYFLFKIFRGPADLDETISQSVRAS